MMGIYGHMAYNHYHKEKPIFKIKFKPRGSCLLHLKSKEVEPEPGVVKPKSNRGRKPKNAMGLQSGCKSPSLIFFQQDSTKPSLYRA
jgi:hypothetical protein